MRPRAKREGGYTKKKRSVLVKEKRKGGALSRGGHLCPREGSGGARRRGAKKRKGKSALKTEVRFGGKNRERGESLQTKMKGGVAKEEGGRPRDKGECGPRGGA